MKNRSKFFWIYSIALFSVAFILIGFSAFTGVRYQEEKTEARKIYQGAQSSVLELQERMEELEKENSELKEQISKLKSEAEVLKITAQKADAMEKLSKVQNLINSKNKTEAKEIFETIDGTLLSDEALTLYEGLKTILY